MLLANMKKSKSRIMKGSLFAKKTAIEFFPGARELQIFHRCTAGTTRFCEAEFTWAICMPQEAGGAGGRSKQCQGVLGCAVFSKRYLI